MLIISCSEDISAVWGGAFTLAHSRLERFELAVRTGLLEDTTTTIRSIARVLATLPQTIQEIHICADPVYCISDQLLEVPWADLDNALSGHRALRTVTLSIPSEDYDATMPELLQTIKERFINMKGILKVVL